MTAMCAQQKKKKKKVRKIRRVADTPLELFSLDGPYLSWV